MRDIAGARTCRGHARLWEAKFLDEKEDAAKSDARAWLVAHKLPQQKGAAGNSVRLLNSPK